MHMQLDGRVQLSACKTCMIYLTLYACCLHAPADVLLSIVSLITACFQRQSLLYDADPNVIARHQPMVVSPDRIHSSYNTITLLPSYAMPAYLLTFNEPNYIYSYGTSDDDTNVLDPATAAGLWPQLVSYFDPLGIKLIAPSAINCKGDPNCQNVPTAAGWLSAFQTVR